MTHSPYRQNKLFTLGTAQLGMNYGVANLTGKPSKEEAISLIEFAISEGITNIDTARAYGDSEAIIGEALSRKKNSQKINVVTKLSPLKEINQSSSKEEIVKAVEKSIDQSLELLQMNSIQSLLLHRWEHYFAYDGIIWKTLLKLKEKGYINTLGASIYYPQEAIEALKEPEIKHLQLPFNILDWRWKAVGVSEQVLSKKDVVVDARSVLLQGLLVGNPSIWLKAGINDGEYWLNQLNFLKDQLNRKSIVDLCFAYVRSQSWISSIVLGIDNIQQLKQNVQLYETSLLSHSECELIETTLTGATEELLNPSNWKTNVK